MLPKIKANLHLPEDEEILKRVEGIIRELLSKERNSSARQLIQTVCIFIYIFLRFLIKILRILIFVKFGHITKLRIIKSINVSIHRELIFFLISSMHVNYHELRLEARVISRMN